MAKRKRSTPIKSRHRRAKRARFGRSRRAAQSKFRLRRPRSRTVAALSSIVETKKFFGLGATLSGDWSIRGVVSQALPYNKISTFLPLDCFLSMRYATDVATHNQSSPTAQELANNCLEGTSLFAKYLTMKVQIDYPDGNKAPVSKQPRPCELIWGWVNPMNLTQHTTPVDDQVTYAQIRQHIINAVQDDFDNMADPLQFHDKQRRLYNIIGRKKIKPQFNRNVPSQASFTAPKMITTIKFPMNKKVSYQKSQEDPMTDPFAVGNTFGYPNQAYLPFVMVFNPDAAYYEPPSGTPPEEYNDYFIQASYNDCLWYYDA